MRSPAPKESSQNNKPNSYTTGPLMFLNVVGETLLFSNYPQGLT